MAKLLSQLRAASVGCTWVVAAVSLLTACGRSEPAEYAQTPGPISNADSAWCNVLEVLRSECQECHARGAQSPAPMPLETYADLAAPAVTDPSKRVYELVSVRIHDSRRPMPEAPRMLSAEQLMLLDSWIAGGAVQGAASCDTGSNDSDAAAGIAHGPDGSTFVPPGQSDGGAGSGATDGAVGPAPSEWPADCENVYTLRVNDNGQPHAVAPRTETHPQFVFDAPWGSDEVQALAIRPVTDNKKVIHHWILYENTGSIGGQFLVSWAPGKEGMRTFPSDVGVYMPSGARALRLDVHYYNLGGDAQELDQSGVEICVTRNFRPNTATTYAFSASATAPPGHSDNSSTCTVSTTGSPAYLISSSPHMHKLGVHAKFSRTLAGSELVLDDGPFSVENQHVKALDRVELQTGDRVTTVCSYDNDTNRTVRFGQNTDDEMCFNFALYYPMGALRCTGGTGI